MQKTIVLGGLFALASVELLATTVRAPLFSELVSRAKTIALVTVVDQRAEWTDTSHGRVIVTWVTARVRECLKGTCGIEERLRMPGGTIGDTGVRVEGLPSLVTGEDYVLFLDTAPDRLSPVVGWMHGQFRVGRDARGEAWVTTYDGRPLSSVTQLGSEPVEISRATVPTMSLTTFLTAIRTEAGDRGSRPRQ